MTGKQKWEGRKILLESGDWILVPPKETRETNLQSLPIHLPCRSGCILSHREGYHKPECGLCGDRVPDEIEAAYILHNWEIRERS